MNVSNCALIDWNQTDMDLYNDRKGLQGVRRLFFGVFWIFWTKIDLGETRFELPTLSLWTGAGTPTPLGPDLGVCSCILLS